VDWPVRGDQVRMLAGQKVQVRVRSAERRSIISLVRVDRAGKVMSVVARRVVRTGTFTAKVPTAGVPTRYRLRVVIAGRPRREALITTPSASSLWSEFCPGPTGPVTMIVDTPTVKAGDVLRYRVESRNGSCLVGSGLYPSLFYVHPNGSPEFLQPPGGTPLIGFVPHSVAAGWSQTGSVSIGADATPGHYQVVHGAAGRYITDDLVSHRIAGDFTVVR
jgi:hypothetical protein